MKTEDFIRVTITQEEIINLIERELRVKYNCEPKEKINLNFRSIEESYHSSRIIIAPTVIDCVKK